MDLGFWVLVAACAAVPLLWGVVAARFFARRDARKGRFVPPERPGSDYSI